MITCLRLQINLYPHKDTDHIIIKQLNLDQSENPNKEAKKLLHQLASGINPHISNNSQEELLVLQQKLAKAQQELAIYKERILLLNSELEGEKKKNKLSTPVKVNAIDTIDERLLTSIHALKI